MSYESSRCLRRLSQTGEFSPLVHYEVVADSVTVYSGYNDEKAWFAFVIAGKGGARRVIRLLNGVRVTFSTAM